MELIEIAPVPDAALPVAAFRAHLRLGTGFADETSADAALLAYLRAAIAVIEGRCGRALVARSFRLVVRDWRRMTEQLLPLAPVSAITAFDIRNRLDEASPVAPQRWSLARDSERPRLVMTGGALPRIPRGGQGEITFTAGFGASWTAVPADLAQAVFLLAAQYYEGRTGMMGGLPAPVNGLLARWRPIRLTAGGHRA